MKVRLIAATLLMNEDRDDLLPYVQHNVVGFARDEWVQNADELAEIAGRLCYKSWKRPNPATSTNSGYIRNILDQGHYSVLEHASATFWISGVSRSLTHELVRHRHLSFSQVSQRYVDESEGDMVLHPAITEENGLDPSFIRGHMSQVRREYSEIVDLMVQHGVDRKTARGAARGVLPNATATEIIVTGNHRTFLEVISKRIAPGADAEIRKLAAMLLIKLHDIAPNTYQNLWSEFATEAEYLAGKIPI